jgi:hypothetical protein
MKLRSHSSVSCHLVAIHGTPTQEEGNVIQLYYRYAEAQEKGLFQQSTTQKNFRPE